MELCFKRVLKHNFWYSYENYRDNGKYQLMWDSYIPYLGGKTQLLDSDKYLAVSYMKLEMIIEMKLENTSKY